MAFDDTAAARGVLLLHLKETETYSIQDYLVSMHMSIENAPKFGVVLQNFTLDIMEHLKNLHRDYGKKLFQIFFKFFDDFKLGDIAELRLDMQGDSYKLFHKKQIIVRAKRTHDLYTILKCF